MSSLLRKDIVGQRIVGVWMKDVTKQYGKKDLSIEDCKKQINYLLMDVIIKLSSGIYIGLLSEGCKTGDPIPTVESSYLIGANPISWAETVCENKTIVEVLNQVEESPGDLALLLETGEVIYNRYEFDGCGVMTMSRSELFGKHLDDFVTHWGGVKLKEYKLLR